MQPLTLRLFVAAAPPEAVRRRVAAFADAWRAVEGEAQRRWVAPSQYHVTLRFLGETPAAWTHDLLRAVRAAEAEHGAFAVGFDRVEPFPPRAPRTLAMLPTRPPPRRFAGSANGSTPGSTPRFPSSRVERPAAFIRT